MYQKPTKQELESLLFYNTFTETAKILSVKSKTTIYRWCEYYNLPNSDKAYNYKRFINKLKLINPNIKILSKYKSAKEAVKVECLICGYEWESIPDNLLHNHGCSCCNGHKLSEIMFKEKLKLLRPDIVLLDKFDTMRKYVYVQCNICNHKWWVLPANLIYNKTQCPDCYAKSRTGENSKCLADLNILLEESLITYYWIGFLLADGNFTDSRLKLKLAKKDNNHVKKFAQYIKYQGSLGDEENSLSVMNTGYVSMLNNKFNINNRKTYNPPNITWIKDKNLLLSLIVGFIDGDGYIGKQYKRNDCILRIKCHSSWLDNLQYMTNTLYDLVYLSPSKVKINNQGYASVNIGNSIVLKNIKLKTIEFNLPILERKWNLINI